MLDGYDHRGEFTTERERYYRMVRESRGSVELPIRQFTPLSDRIARHIDQLETDGKTPRHLSNIIVPRLPFWTRMGNRTFYRLYNLHKYDYHNEPATSGFQPAINNAHSKVYVKDGTYTMNSSPVITNAKNFLNLEGESWGVKIQPGGAVNSLTLQPAAGVLLIGVKIKDFSFLDPNGNQAGKSAILLDAATNVGQIAECFFEKILFGGTGVGKTSGKGIYHNYTAGVAGVAARCIFRDINVEYAGYLGANTGYYTDSIIDLGFALDNQITRIFTECTVYSAGGNAMFEIGHGASTPSGNVLQHLYVFMNNEPPVDTPIIDINADTAVWIRWVDLEQSAGSSHLIGIQYQAGAPSDSLVDSCRIYGMKHGINFTATAAGTAIPIRIWRPNFFKCTNAFNSVAGDTSLKTIFLPWFSPPSGGFGNTNRYTPNPLTGATVYGEYPKVGWNIATPAVPAGTGAGNAVTNNTGYVVMVYVLTGTSVGTHIVDPSGTDKLVADDALQLLDPGAKIYYATTVPTTWLWGVAE